MAVNIGPRIGIDGEAQYRKQIGDIIAKNKALAAEMQAVTSSFAKNATTQEKSRATGDVLARQIENQKKIISEYTSMVQRSTQARGADDAVTQKWLAQLHKAEAELNRMRAAEDGAADAADDLADSTEESGKAARSAGGGWTVLKGIVADFAANAIRNAVSGIKEFAASSINTAAEVKASAAQYKQTFGEMEQEADAMLHRVSGSAGMLETRLRDSASGIYAFARSAGAESGEAMQLTEGALTAAADAAAFYDKTMEESTETLQSFLKGNYANDAALGVSCTETTRNAAAMAQFGKKFSDLTETQKQQTLLKMVTDAQKLSGAVGQASRESGEWANVQGNLNETVRQFKATVGGRILEPLVSGAKEATKWIKELQTGFQAGGMQGLMDGLSSVAGQAVASLSASLPRVATFATDLLTSLGSGIVENLPVLIDAGMQTIPALINGITTALPQLIGYIPTLISGISTTLTDNLPTLIESGVSMLVALVEGIVKALPELVLYMPQIIVQMTAALLKGVVSLSKAGLELIMAVVRGIGGFLQGDNLRRIGRNVVEGIMHGITGAYDWLRRKLKSWVGNVLEFIQRLFGIHSPSRLMRDEVGLNLGFGVGEGFEASIGAVKQTVGRGLRSVADFASGVAMDVRVPAPQLGVRAYGGSGAAYGSAYAGPISINVYGAAGQDVNTLADAVIRKLNVQVERRRAVWA